MRSAWAARNLQDLVCGVALPRFGADLGSARRRGDLAGVCEQLRGRHARFDERLGHDAVREHPRINRDDDHLAARARGPNAPRHRTSRGVRPVVANDDAAFGRSVFAGRNSAHPVRAPVSLRGGAAAAGRPVVSPIAFDLPAGQSGATREVAGAPGSIPSARATRHSAPIPDAVVASVTSRRWCPLRRRRRRSRPRATRRALARLSTVGGWPIESASSLTVASRSVIRSRTRRSRGLRCSRWTSSRKRSRDTDLCWPAGASPDAESALVFASSWA
jgi:hypothetical protein